MQGPERRKPKKMQPAGANVPTANKKTLPRCHGRVLIQIVS
jgi:hypothetical protein